jgi:ABC-type polysaccharide/polyol phosphate transport system ATPase subunit
MRLAFSVIAHVDADVLIIDEALAVYEKNKGK